MNDLKALIREIPDYPKPGILFYDLTTLLKDPAGFHSLVDQLCEQYDGTKVDIVAGIEARGFIFAPALAYRLGAGFVPVRKPKKLPGKTTFSHLPARIRHRPAGTPPRRHQARTNRADLRRSAGHRRHCRGHRQTNRATRRQSSRRSLRRRTHFPQRPRQTPRHSCIFAAEVRQIDRTRRMNREWQIKSTEDVEGFRAVISLQVLSVFICVHLWCLLTCCSRADPRFTSTLPHHLK